MDRTQKLVETMMSLIEDKFGGYIKINFSQGSLGRIEKCEEVGDAAVVLPSDKVGGEKTR